MLLQIIQLISTITTSLIQPNRIITANDLVDSFLSKSKKKKIIIIQWWLRGDSILNENRKKMTFEWKPQSMLLQRSNDDGVVDPTQSTSTANDLVDKSHWIETIPFWAKLRNKTIHKRTEDFSMAAGDIPTSLSTCSGALWCWEFPSFGRPRWPLLLLLLPPPPPPSATFSPSSLEFHDFEKVLENGGSELGFQFLVWWNANWILL